jgi:hypothetical protein
VTNPFRVFICGKSFLYYPILIPCRILFLCLRLMQKKFLLLYIVLRVLNSHLKCTTATELFIAHFRLRALTCFMVMLIESCYSILTSFFLCFFHISESALFIAIFSFVALLIYYITSISSFFFFFLIVSLFFYPYHLSCLFPHTHVISGFLPWHFMKYLKMVSVFQ